MVLYGVYKNSNIHYVSLDYDTSGVHTKLNWMLFSQPIINLISYTSGKMLWEFFLIESVMI